MKTLIFIMIEQTEKEKHLMEGEWRAGRGGGSGARECREGEVEKEGEERAGSGGGG